MFVLHADLPPADIARPQRLALIDDVGAFIRGNLAGVPAITPVLGEPLGAAGYPDLVGSLPLTPALEMRGHQLPAQARLAHVQTLGLSQVLATQVGDLHGRPRCGPGGTRQQERSGGEADNQRAVPRAPKKDARSPTAKLNHGAVTVVVHLPRVNPETSLRPRAYRRRAHLSLPNPAQATRTRPSALPALPSAHALGRNLARRSKPLAASRTRAPVIPMLTPRATAYHTRSILRPGALYRHAWASSLGHLLRPSDLNPPAFALQLRPSTRRLTRLAPQRRVLAPSPRPDRGLHQTTTCYPIFPGRWVMNSFAAQLHPLPQKRPLTDPLRGELTDDEEYTGNTGLERTTDRAPRHRSSDLFAIVRISYRLFMGASSRCCPHLYRPVRCSTRCRCKLRPSCSERP